MLKFRVCPQGDVVKLSELPKQGQFFVPSCIPSTLWVTSADAVDDVTINACFVDDVTNGEIENDCQRPISFRFSESVEVLPVCIDTIYSCLWED